MNGKLKAMGLPILSIAVTIVFYVTFMQVIGDFGCPALDANGSSPIITGIFKIIGLCWL